jgi:hypothetical protein
MFEKFHRKSLTATVAALLAAAGVGGIAMAQNSGSSTTPAPSSAAPAAPSTGAADTPESANDTADAPDSPNEKGETPDGPNDKADGPESANEKADSGTESASEVPGDDGPGGHADEATGNANATTQQQGQN